MTEQQLAELARRAAQHLYDEDVRGPYLDDRNDDWRAALGRAIVLIVRDVLAEHEDHPLHRPPNRP